MFTQCKYIKWLLVKAKMEQCKSSSTPSSEGFDDPTLVGVLLGPFSTSNLLDQICLL